MRFIDLGCGGSRKAGFFGIDIKSGVGDLVRDITKGLPYDDNSVDEFFSKNCFEHLSPLDLIYVMQECYRTLKPGGKFELIVPLGIVPDWSHQSFFHKFTFENMFSQESNYGVNFKVVSKVFHEYGEPFCYTEMRLVMEK